VVPKIESTTIRNYLRSPWANAIVLLLQTLYADSIYRFSSRKLSKKVGLKFCSTRSYRIGDAKDKSKIGMFWSGLKIWEEGGTRLLMPRRSWVFRRTGS
jgi:hypothetical protein